VAEETIQSGSLMNQPNQSAPDGPAASA